MKKRLYRINQGKKLTGVCGGIAKYCGIDPKIIRLIWVICFFTYGSGLVAYILCSIIIPKERE
ncbi:PspC domain-containing protein [Anaerosporobacter faecicola]|uniref:PspC domain-containing protein n=1 Tax=Anaerosporobacter faecicola TaxID=2718714 RepID=UPI00143BB9D1|nr:PspC domain-containing protein [Anaerosporobacter faecicola]